MNYHDFLRSRMTESETSVGSAKTHLHQALVLRSFPSAIAADKSRGYLKNASQEPHTLHANEDKLIRDLEYGRAISGRKKKPKKQNNRTYPMFL